MNYRLSSAVVRPLGKVGFIIEVGGKELVKYVGSVRGDNLKSETLRVITMGLRSTRPFIKHDDTLVIEVPNVHLCEWLGGKVEQKDYVAEIDDLYGVLESLDCKYKFMFVKNPYAKKIVETTKKTEVVSGSSVMDSMSEFE